MSDSAKGADHRFGKGRSGNPMGRPRKPAPDPTGSAFDIIIDQRLTITQGGVPREVTVEDALQHRTYKDAIGGSRQAQRQIMKMVEKREKWLAAKAPVQRRSIESTSETDPDNAETAMLLLGIASRNPERSGPEFEGNQLLLEPWAVQVALSRRRGGERLGERDVFEITRCTRDAKQLRWPQGTKA